MVVIEIVQLAESDPDYWMSNKKALLGYSMNDYNLRLRTTRFPLLHSEKTIAEIAYEVGFSSPDYFSHFV